MSHEMSRQYFLKNRKMLLSLGKTNREHLHYLTLRPVQIVEDFCELAPAFLNKGPTTEVYAGIAQKLEEDVEVIQNCIYGLVHLLLLSCKHQLSEADFRDAVLTIGFSPEQQAVLSNLYTSTQDEIHKVLKVPIKESHYDDLRWRFEVQVASRSLLNQAVPLVTLELTSKTDVNGVSHKEKQLLQTDPNNLQHLVNELEKASFQSKSRHSKKVEKALKN